MSSGSDSESNRSGSPIHQGPAPTPGHGLDRSTSNSPEFRNKSREASPAKSRSRTGSPASNRSRSGSRSRSHSAESDKSHHSAGSNRSRKSRSRSSSVESNRSGSGSNKSKSPAKSGSGTPAGSHRSRSSSRGSRSGSHASQRSRSRSPASHRSRSPSGASHRSRSPSAASHRSRSQSAASHRSRSRSAASRRSKSADSNRSKSAGSNRSAPSRARSPSPEHPAGSRDHSRSNSPDLQIDEPPGTPESGKSDKGKRDSFEEQSPKKKSRVIGSDSEEEDKDGKEDGKEVSAAAIFGDDADDISSEEEKEDKDDSEKDPRKSDEDERRSDDDNQVEKAPEDEEEKDEPEPIPETRIDVEIPKISCDLGRDIHFVKLPNFLSVETRPFDPETYEDEIDEEETLDEEGRARLKLKVENTIRWKETVDAEGNVKKNSNARLVRWSDGSYSLHLGSEIFDVYKQPLQGDHNHLFIRQGTGLQGQAVFRTKLSFRPHSTESFTHRKMTLSLADRSQKTSGIKILSQVGADPDHDRKMLLKKEEEKLRQTVRVSKPRKKGDGGSRSHNSSSVYREDEGSDEEGAISLNAIKNKYKSGAATASKGGAIYSSDEEGSDIEARRARKLDKSKALKDSDSSGESE